MYLVFYASYLKPHVKVALPSLLDFLLLVLKVYKDYENENILYSRLAL